MISADQAHPGSLLAHRPLIDNDGDDPAPRRVSTGAGPHGVVIDPTGTHAWVTNSYDDTVSVIDIPTQSVRMATIPVGMGPNGISYHHGHRPQRRRHRTEHLRCSRPAPTTRSHRQTNHPTRLNGSRFSSPRVAWLR